MTQDGLGFLLIAGAVLSGGHVHMVVGLHTMSPGSTGANENACTLYVSIKLLNHVMFTAKPKKSPFLDLNKQIFK